MTWISINLDNVAQNMFMLNNGCEMATKLSACFILSVNILTKILYIKINNVGENIVCS